MDRRSNHHPRFASLDDLVTAALHGDQSAWAALATVLLPTARGAAAEVLGKWRQADAEDVAAEAMRVVCARLPSLRERGRVVAWTAAIARHRGLNLATRSKELAVDPVDLDRPEHLPAQHSERIDLARALRRLPAEQREALVLSVVEGFSFDEIGVIQGVSKNTASSRARLARERLRELLGAEL